MFFLFDHECRTLMTLVHLAIKQGSDSDGDLDASAPFTPYALSTELHGVTRIAHRILTRRGTCRLRMQTT